jgi:hypothetical protein
MLAKSLIRAETPLWKLRPLSIAVGAALSFPRVLRREKQKPWNFAMEIPAATAAKAFLRQ